MKTMKLSIEYLMVGDYVYYDGNVFIEDEYEPAVELEIVKILNGDDIDLAYEECFYG